MKNFKTLQAGHYYRDAVGTIVQIEAPYHDLFRSVRGNVIYWPNGDVECGAPSNYRIVEEVTVTPVEAPKPRECWVAYIHPQNEPRHVTSVQPRPSRDYEWVRMREVSDE